MSRYLCSICVRRDADTLDCIDGKHRPVCAACLLPVADPAEPKLVTKRGGSHAQERVVRFVLRCPGLTALEIREELKVPGPADDKRAADAFSASLSRARKAGYLERRGKYPEFTYWPAEQRRAA